MTGSKKIRKSNLRKEGYNINEITDPLYMWNSSERIYTQFDSSKLQAIIQGKLEF